MRQDKPNERQDGHSRADLLDEMVVACVSCESQFEAFAPARAEGCAADIQGLRVTGFPGSFVANQRQFLFAEGVQLEHLGSGVICDECISQLLSQGALVDAGQLAELPDLSRLRVRTYH